MKKKRDRRDPEEERQQKHDEQVECRGILGDVCSNAESNAENPELCGTEEPIVDAKGRPLRPERYDRRVDRE